MNDANNAEDAQWRAQLETLGEKDSRLAAFVARALAAADPQDLALYDPETLVALWRETARHLGAREPGAADIRIWSDPDAATGVSVIDIYSEDMPFIVDSALAAIRAKGGDIVFMTHPLLAVDRAAEPWAILERTGESGWSESVLHVHIATPAQEALTQAIREELDAVMVQVRRTVAGWRPMLERLRNVVVNYRKAANGLSEADAAEAMHFLAWLADHNFTFLGMREYALAGEAGNKHLEPVPESGLGILEDPQYRYLRKAQDYVHTTDQHVAFLASREPILVTKANARTIVHRRVHMDYIGIKLFDAEGAIAGELRILGLFTSMALATPHTDVPLVRRKISEVVRRSQLDTKSHAGKALMNALDHYPRDELFQIAPDQLLEFAKDVASLPDRPRVRVLPRLDRFDNFVSVIVFMPRERYDSQVRARVGDYLAERYAGRVSAFTPDFPEGDLARVHFIIGRSGGATPQPDRDALEADIAELTRDFGERLLAAAQDRGAVAPYAEAFSPAYQSAFSHTQALADIATFSALHEAEPLAVALHDGREAGTFSLRFYSLGLAIPLSDRVPMLENFGFTVIDERTYDVRPQADQVRHLHDMTLRYESGEASETRKLAPLLEPALLAAQAGAIESDGFNGLLTAAGMAHGDVAVLRALGRYLKQVGIAYSQRYLWRALRAQPDMATALIALFHTLHDPNRSAERTQQADRLREKLEEGFARIESIDEDRIIHRFLNLIEASVRTNLYQRDDAGRPRPALAIKYEAGKIEGLPAPKPYREIAVYSPRVEGVHLRGGPIARGGLRWSDRPEDFRTEVLGLVKAQMVKNAVIVPVGAKGGFVPKQMPTGDRDAIYAEGTACYRIYVGALLDVTDNLDGEVVVPPEQTVRRDNDDPYLVVAADKGTARFSDTANAIAQERDYWLDDAFASGGSAGYDHKAMAITARGAWEAVKRHFREMDIDIQSEPFTVAGVGDMSGDVFGNGMLLSRKIRLVAAFDHRDIFLDPDPDPETSFAERERMFALPRSSWQDYDQSTISQGGGVFSRARKSIPLSQPLREILGIEAEEASPAQIMRAILAAPVDLMWFGGIGTYMRAAGERDADVGDRANDAIRVTAEQMRAKVVGEGANLGITQLGRVAFAQKGGRINTDAIDNSGGVNSSDLEVNIKIALAPLLRSGALAREDRDAFLAEMTDAVAQLCLRNNYLQTLALSLQERKGMAGMPDLIDFLHALEADDAIDRAVEDLPDDAALGARMEAGQPFTRPELAVLLAHAKIHAFSDLQASRVPDDPYLSRELYRYFPDALNARYPEAVEDHKLRRDVIATVLSNAMINRGGPAFVERLARLSSRDTASVAFAYAAARDCFGLADLNARIDALDTEIDGETQLALYGAVQRLQVEQSLWFLRNEDFEPGLSDLVSRYGAGVAALRDALDEFVTPRMREAFDASRAQYLEAGVPEALAESIAALPGLALASDIVLVAERARVEPMTAAQVYFHLLDRFSLGGVVDQGALVSASDRYDRMARDRALANFAKALRDLSCDVLDAMPGPVQERIETWETARKDALARVNANVTEMLEGELTVSRLTVAAGLLADLSRG